MKSIALPGPAAAFVSAGGRDVDTSKLAVDAAAGDHRRLVDDRGDELGLAVADPDNARLRVLATPADGFPAIGGALLGWRVERACSAASTALEVELAVAGTLTPERRLAALGCLERHLREARRDAARAADPAVRAEYEATCERLRDVRRMI